MSPGPDDAADTSPGTGRRLAWGLAATAVVGLLIDLATLLLLPLRISGHLAPIAPVAVLVGNALLGVVAGRLLASRAPATVLVVLALLLSVVGASSGPGGDLLVTRDLQVVYLAYVVAATLGAALPLVPRRSRASARTAASPHP